MDLSRTRRKFLYSCGALAAAGSVPLKAAELLPKVREFRRGGMSYRSLGRTGIDVSLLSFGSHTDPADKVALSPGRSVLTSQGQERRNRIIAHAFDLGVNLLDVYDSEGQWEPAAKLAAGRRDKVLISLSHTSGERIGRNVDRAAKLFGHVDLFRFHTADLEPPTLEAWDVLRKAREAGKVRAIGIASHIEPTLLNALTELEGIDYVFFPYNFIHARADYSLFLPAAVKAGVGLIAMKPLAAGSLVNLDPSAHAGARPEEERITLWQSDHRPVLPQAVAELTKSLQRLPDETLCMASMRFVYSRPFVACAIVGMFDDQWVTDNHTALQHYHQAGPEQAAVLNPARTVARLRGASWMDPRYRWLEQRWRA